MRLKSYRLEQISLDIRTSKHNDVFVHDCTGKAHVIKRIRNWYWLLSEDGETKSGAFERFKEGVYQIIDDL